MHKYWGETHGGQTMRTAILGVRKGIVGAVVVLILGGCITVPDRSAIYAKIGVKPGSLDESKVAQLKEGVSVRGDVIALFGAPKSQTLSSDGTETLMYLYAGDTSGYGNIQTLLITLDSSGKLQKWTTSRPGVSTASRETRVGGGVAHPPVQPSASSVPSPSTGPTVKAMTLYEAAEQGQIEVVKRLIANGANVNEAEKEFGITPLMSAAFKNRVEIVEILLANGADPNAKTTNGKSVLHFAVGGGNEMIVQTLINHGAGEKVTGTISAIEKKYIYIVGSNAPGYGEGMAITLNEHPSRTFFVNQELAASSGLIEPQRSYEMMSFKVGAGTKLEFVFCDIRGDSIVFSVKVL